MTLTSGPVPAPHRASTRPGVRSRLAVGAALLVLLTVGGGAAPAAMSTTSAVHRQPNGVLVVDSGRVTVVYDGHVIDQARLLELNERHRATFYAGDVAAAEHGHAHVFDTMAELDAYSARLLEGDQDQTFAPAAPNGTAAEDR